MTSAWRRGRPNRATIAQLETGRPTVAVLDLGGTLAWGHSHSPASPSKSPERAASCARRFAAFLR